MAISSTLNSYSVKHQNYAHTTIVVIDSRVQDYEFLLKGIEPSAQILILDKQDNGIDKITAVISQQSIHSLQLIAHGSSGSLQLGNTSLNLDNLHTYQQQLQKWQVEEILLYSCEIAAAEQGKALLAHLHQITGASIAASDQKIGDSQQGGSWELPIKIGQISSSFALQPEVRENYAYVLGTGPGGVETTDGLSNLELWLKANTVVGTNNTPVTTWADRSGNGLNATQTTINRQPIIVNNAINGQSVLQFDGIDDNFIVPLNINPSSMPNMTVFAVFSSDTANKENRKLYGNDDGGFDRSVGLDSRVTDNFTYFGGPGTVRNYSNIASNNYYLSSHTYTLATFNGWINGGSPVSGSVNNGSGLTNLSLGSLSPGFDVEFWDGNIAEFIIFNKVLNTAERNIVDNYLGAKYNLPLANDRYTGDNAGTDYDLDVSGIGRETNGNNTSATSSGLTITSNTFLLDNGDYLLFGHNQTTTNSLVNTELPAGILNRWSRVWNLDKTDNNNNNGTINLTFDYSDSGLGGTPNGNYSLLYRTGNTGNFTVVSGLTSSISGDQVTFSGVNTSLLSDGFYTLATINNPPALAAASGSLLYTENATATVISSTGLGITDIDHTNISSATIQITVGYQNGQDVLSVLGSLPTGISASAFDASTGTLTLSGSATLANYQLALQKIAYSNTSDNPNTANRTVSFTVNDGIANSNTVTQTISVTAVNDDAILGAASGSLAYTENDSPTAISATGLGITDVDNTNISSATIQITGGYQNGQDVLSVLGSLPTGITASAFDAATSTLTLSGSATLANYQLALQKIAYSNTSNNPNTANRTVSFTVNDGIANSNTVTQTISVTAVNSAPIVTPTTFTIPENTTNGTVVGTLTGSDVESSPLSNWTITGGNANLDGDNNLAFVIDSTGKITVNDSGDLDFKTQPQFNLQVTVSDGSLTSDPANVTINLLKVQKFTPGNDVGKGTSGDDIMDALDGDDRLYGFAGKDTILSGIGADIAYGGNDNDNVDGGDGNDRLYGDDGNDTLLGGAGADILYGGAGDDLLNGGLGSDRYYGEAGTDTFVIGSGDGLDSIYGYEQGIDKILVLGSISTVEKKSGSNLLITSVTAAGTELLATVYNVAPGQLSYIQSDPDVL